ncbi:MAG: hypothetical protein ACFFCP_07590, partial [Promethearchaeota archaeon]
TLIREGFERPKAHEKLRVHSQTALQSGKSLLEIVKADPDFAGVIERGDLNVEKYYDDIRKVSKLILKEAVSEYRKTLPK